MSALGERHGDLHAAHAVMAEDDEFAVAGQVVDPGGRLAHGKDARAFEGRNGDLLVFAHIDQYQGFAACEAVFDLGRSGHFDWRHENQYIGGAQPLDTHL